MGKQPRKVTAIPEGYVFSHRDEATGRDIYKIKEETKPVKSTKIITEKKPAVKSTGTSSVLKAPIKRKTLPTVNEDFVFIEPPVEKINEPSNTIIPIKEDLRIDRKLQPPINPNVDYYKYPDPNAGYSKPSNMYFDKITQRPVDIIKSIGPDGTYNPVYTDTLTANEGKYQGTIKQGNPRITTDPTKTDVLEGNKIDKSGTKKGEIVGTIGFKKGGLVQKLAGGGGVKGDTNGDGYIDALEQKALDDKKNQNASNAKNMAGSVLGGLGTSYYTSKQPSSEGDSLRSAGLSAASQTGAIGGVIGGVAAIGDKIGAKPKANAEKVDPVTGELRDESGAKTMAGIGIGLSPSKRLSYEGGLTDVTGQKYIKSIEDKTKKQLNEVNAANRMDKMNQIVAARNAQEDNPMLKKQYDLSGATFDENHNLILANDQQFNPNRYAKGGLVGKMKMDAEMMKHHKQMCSEGGEIEGKGGPKDDKIEAKVKEGSFVVPAENAELAKGIRKLYLKAPIKKANLKQEEGEEVKLSNGEHLFTPEENEYLESIGIDLEDLAPNAEHGEEEMAKGGLTAKKARMILHDKHVNGKPLTDKQRRFFGAISSGASIKMACGGEVKGYAEGGPVKGTKIDGATWNGKNWVSDNGSVYSAEGGKKFTDKYNQSVAKEKANEEQRKASEISVYSRKLKEATNAGNAEEAKRLQAKINQLSGSKPEVKSETSSEVVKSKPSLKAPSLKKQQPIASKTEPFTVNANPDEEVIVPGDKLSPNERAIANADAEKATVQAAALNKSLPQNVVDNGTPVNRRRGIADVIANVDPTSFVGIGQAALGVNMLKDEKRPVDKAVIDPTYNDAVNRSIQDAKFGLSPEQRFAAEQDIQNSLNDARFAARSKGFSASDTLNQERASINDAWRNKLGLKTADTEMRMNKQKYADAMAADRANILSANRRQAFNDAMATFQQKQQAGSELVGAGLQNIIGAYRFNKEMQNNRNVNDASNPYKNI